MADVTAELEAQLEKNRIKTAEQLIAAYSLANDEAERQNIFGRFFTNVGGSDGDIERELRQANRYWPDRDNPNRNRNSVNKGILLNLRNWKLRFVGTSERKLQRATLIAEMCMPTDAMVDFLIEFLMRVVLKDEPRQAAHFAQRIASRHRPRRDLTKEEWRLIRDAFLASSHPGDVRFAWAASRAANGALYIKFNLQDVTGI